MKRGVAIVVAMGLVAIVLLLAPMSLYVKAAHTHTGAKR